QRSTLAHGIFKMFDVISLSQPNLFTSNNVDPLTTKLFSNCFWDMGIGVKLKASHDDIVRSLRVLAVQSFRLAVSRLRAVRFRGHASSRRGVSRCGSPRLCAASST